MMNYSGNFVQCAVITRQFVGHSIASLGGERWFPINLARSSVALAINDALKNSAKEQKLRPEIEWTDIERKTSQIHITFCL